MFSFLFHRLTVRRSRYLAYGLACGLASVMAGCFSEYERGEVLRETSYSTPPYTVVEEIQYEYSEYSDEFSQRVYFVRSDEEVLAEFRGVTTTWPANSDLALSPPKVVEDWLAIFSKSQVWIWHPEKRTIKFDLMHKLNSDDWAERQLMSPSIPDCWASDFNISNGTWILEFTERIPSERKSNTIRPDRYYLVSEDEGRTFFPVAEDSDIITNSL